MDTDLDKLRMRLEFLWTTEDRLVSLNDFKEATDIIKALEILDSELPAKYTIEKLYTISIVRSKVFLQKNNIPNNIQLIDYVGI